MAKFWVGVLIGVIIVALGIYFYNSASSSSGITGATSQNLTGGSEKGNLKTFVITGAHLRFYMNGIENPELKVKQGDRVRIEFTSTEGFHDWVLDEFDARTERVGDGASAPAIEFVADTKGTFEYYCNVGEHRANGMKGVFVVE